MRKFPVMLRTRVSVEESQLIARNAETADMSVCAYLRERAVGHQVRSTIDVRLLAELRRIGGMVKKLWNEGKREESEAIRVGLDAIRVAIEESGDGR